jgi:hypothetical protein
MSSKLIKNGSDVLLTDDAIVATIRILSSGKIQCEAPTLPPAVLIKHLHNLIVDIMYVSFQPAEISRIVPPPSA